jgi:hypothetical protein
MIVFIIITISDCTLCLVRLHKLNLAIILIYIQQDATLHSLIYLETALHVSGGTSVHHQKRKQLYLQHLVFVTLLLLPAAVEQFPHKINYVTFHLVEYILEYYYDARTHER